MAKHDTKTLLLVAGGVALAGTSGILGPTAKAFFQSTWHTLGGVFSHNPPGSTNPSGTVGKSTATGGTGCMDPASMTADAKAKGITDATSPAAYAYGRNLWACQHGGDPSGYDGAAPDDKVKWNSVAIHGA